MNMKAMNAKAFTARVNSLITSSGLEPFHYQVNTTPHVFPTVIRCSKSTVTQRPNHAKGETLSAKKGAEIEHRN